MQPVIHLLMPLDRVMRLENPVVFVGEVDKTALDPASLQGGECANSLGQRNAIVEFTVDDQHWRLPVLYEVYGIVLFVYFL